MLRFLFLLVSILKTSFWWGICSFPLSYQYFCQNVVHNILKIVNTCSIFQRYPFLFLIMADFDFPFFPLFFFTSLPRVLSVLLVFLKNAFFSFVIFFPVFIFSPLCCLRWLLAVRVSQDFHCFWWPWHFGGVLVSYFVDYLMFSSGLDRDDGFLGRKITEIKYYSVTV